MAQFDQRGQHVARDQYNIGRDLNFGAVQNSVDLASELEKLKNEITRARQDGILDKKKATDVEYQITKAAQEAEEPKPDKSAELRRLRPRRCIPRRYSTRRDLRTLDLDDRASQPGIHANR